MSGDRTDGGPADNPPEEMPRLDTTVAHPARIYDYWLGGKDNYAADRKAGDDIIAVRPTITRDICANRDFMQRAFEWPLAKERRQHVHSRIDAAELPVTHVTRRQGRPYTLVLTKTDALFARELQARARDETDLEWLAAQ